MHFRILGLFLLMITGLSFAAGRSPAVEDFVGIEVDQPSTMPQGTESLFNLENDLKLIEAARKHGAVEAPPAPVYEQESAWSIPAILGICLVLGLPLFSLLLVMH